MKKKLLFVIENLGEGGAERVMSILTNELVLRGYDVSLALLQYNPSVVYPISEKVKIFNLNQGEYNIQENKLLIRFAKKLGLTKIIQYERKRVLLKKLDKSRTIPLRRFIKSNHFDIVISFLIKPNVATIRATQGLNIRTIISERNYPGRNDFPLALIQIKNEQYKMKYECCVAQTREILHLLGEQVEQRGVIIENPINDLLPLTDASEKKHIITNYCSFKPQKNLQLLIRAFSEFVKEYKDYKLELYGRGNKAELEELIEKLNLNDKVSILPFVPNIHNIIKNYAMFISTSNFEGISNSMIEAMAVGIPTISTDCDGGGARAIIRDHENGLLVPKNDCEKLVSAMKEIAANPEMSDYISKNGMKIREEYSKDKIIDKWIDIIENNYAFGE